MFYFFHGTTLEAFASILQYGRIFAPNELPDYLKHHVRMRGDPGYVFTNIYADCIKDQLQPDEKAGLGVVTIIIDPLILKYHKCYFNKFWRAGVNDESIVMNNNVEIVLGYLCSHYRYPYITTHEVLFKGSISSHYITGVICEKELIPDVKKLIDDHSLKIRVFKKFPTLVA